MSGSLVPNMSITLPPSLHFVPCACDRYAVQAQITVILNTKIALLHYHHLHTPAVPLCLLKCSQVQGKSLKYPMLADERDTFVCLSKCHFTSAKPPYAPSRK